MAKLARKVDLQKVAEALGAEIIPADGKSGMDIYIERRISYQFMDIFLGLPANIKHVIADWDGYDEDLKDHYAADLEWVLVTINMHCRQDERFNSARTALNEMASEIEETFGFKPDDFLLLGDK